MLTFKRLLRRPAREDVAPEDLENYDSVVERTLRVHGGESNPANYFGALLNAPPLAAALVHMGRIVREGQLRGSYTDAERELIDIVYGVDFGYNGIFLPHIPDAFAVGVRPEAIEAIRKGREEELTDDERQLATYARQVANGTVTDESYAAIEKRFGVRGGLEYTIFCGFLLMTIRLWMALGVPDMTDEETDELVQGLRDGSVEIPDPAARIG
jgi:hypothetical protein